MEGLQNLRRSKRFWTAVVGLFVMVAVEVVPGFADNAAQVQETVLVIIGLLVGGYTVQDAAAAIATGRTKYDNE